MTAELVLDGAILVAGDDGPRASLEPLLDAGARWGNARVGKRALIAGTSQSEAGFHIEAGARRAAAAAGVPVVCIEDFPGNYRAVEGAPTRLLVVEGAFSERLNRARLADPPPMALVPPARYDTLRAAGRNPGSAAPPYQVLWAGQPETDSCLATLEEILPFLRSPDVELQFRAHPRDDGYLRGEYRKLLDGGGVRWRDVTAAALASVYASPLDLVVTQYSSIAVEAGFLGVPSVHVLLPHAGAALLHAQKGYRVPMPCDAGASFHLGDPRSLKLLDTALRDAPARGAVMARFRELYHIDFPQVPRLVERVAGIIAR